MKSLFSRPATTAYPFVKRKIITNSRGKIIIEKDKCIFCNLCAKKCPTSAIIVNKTNKVWSIDRLNCISCNACVDACPKKCLLNTGETSPPSITRDRDVF